eukprot:9742985-Alexandrium_andersonii.AAC.1
MACGAKLCCFVCVWVCVCAWTCVHLCAVWVCHASVRMSACACLRVVHCSRPPGRATNRKSTLLLHGTCCALLSWRAIVRVHVHITARAVNACACASCVCECAWS